jgi:hypothetical protein
MKNRIIVFATQILSFGALLAFDYIGAGQMREYLVSAGLGQGFLTLILLTVVGD